MSADAALPASMALTQSSLSGVPETLGEDNRDIADLWNDALKSYRGIVGFDLQRKFDDVQSMVEFGTNEMKNFHKFRHNDKKVDQLRGLFKSNLDYLEKGAQQLIAAAVPAFPPAAAIGTALTYLLTACRQVSADYDVVVVFFDDMNSFLARIVILETRMPRHKAYQNCLMDVFTSFLTVCGYAHKYIELGRFKKWISNLLSGEDSDLGGARKKMDKDLSRLQNATEFAILGNTEELKKMNTELKVNQNSHREMLEAQRQVMDSIHEDTESIKNDMAKLLSAFKEQNAKHEAKAPPDEANKPATANKVRNAMPTVTGDSHEYRILKETLIRDTCGWVFAESEWTEWIKTKSGQRPVLAIVGQPGVGKSHLAASVHDKLLERVKEDAEHTCAAHFYFREQHPDLRVFLGGVVTVINQVAEQNAVLCEKITALMIRDDVDYEADNWKDLLKSLMRPLFDEASGNHLFIVLDGLDEIYDRDSVFEFVKMVKEEKLNISVVVTTRPELVKDMSERAEVVSIEVTKEKQQADFKALTWQRIANGANLRKFRRYVQQRIAERVEEVSPNMLYAEHLLVRLDALGREGAALQALAQDMPTDLPGLYESLLEECQRRMPAARQKVASTLLHWVAFSFRPLTLNEVVSLLQYLSKDNNFNLEEIPEVVSKFLDVGDPAFDAAARDPAALVGSKKSIKDLQETQDATDEDYDDGKLPVKFKERSMRAFLKDLPQGDSAWRLQPSEVHRHIFLQCAELTRFEFAGKIDEGLRKYTSYILTHLTSIEPEKHTLQEQAEVMEALAEVLGKGEAYAQVLKLVGQVYSKKRRSDVNEAVVAWASLLSTTAIGEHLSEFARQWWEDVAVDPRRCRLGIAKGYMRQLYSSHDLSEALAEYKLLRGVLVISDLDKLLAARASQNFPKEYADGLEKHTAAKTSKGEEPKADTAEEKEDEDEDELSEELAVLGILGLFEEIVADANAYRAVAQVLFNYKHYKPAQVTCQKALDLLDSGNAVEKFKALALRANIEVKLRLIDQAHQTIKDCLQDLGNDEIPPTLKRAALMTRAQIEVKIGHSESASASYIEAKRVDPTGLTTGEALIKELFVFEKKKDYAGYMRTVRSWNPLERLTWLAWEYSENGIYRHAEFRRIATLTGEGPFLMEVYQGTFPYLDKLNAGSPFRVDLAMAYIEVMGEWQKAREVLDQVLDSVASGWLYGITNDSPQFVLIKAVQIMTDVLYELFARSQDPAAKDEALQALKGLTERPLATGLSGMSALWLLHRRVIIATMSLKMGHARDFYTQLQSILDDCFAGLRDTVSWNDQSNLEKLGQALCLLSRAIPDGQDVEWHARVILSAIFSRLDSKSEKGEDESGGEDEDEDETDHEAEMITKGSGSDSDSDDDSQGPLNRQAISALPPTDEGDLGDIDDVTYPCDGGLCHPITEFAWWGGRNVHYCVTCSNILFCEPCYESRRVAAADGTLEKKFPVCGKGHSYLSLPVEGWKGIKGGVLNIEGQEPVAFDVFLDNLQNKVCKDAWDRFWLGA